MYFITYKILSYLPIFLAPENVIVSKNYRVDSDVYLQFLFTKRLRGGSTRSDEGTVAVTEHSGFVFSLFLSILSYVTLSVFMTSALEWLCLYPNRYFPHFNEGVKQINDIFAPLLIVNI